jgi:hypothetical protein
MKQFFIWCAGSDPKLLQNCSQREQIKHMGFGTLVLIPAILALISMSFALSTLDALSQKPWFYLSGGILWGLIIFAFDRFIVSTHRKKETNKEELKNPVFYLRFSFAFLLGIVISHPLVMFYFDGSIQDQLADNQKVERELIANDYGKLIHANELRIESMDSLYLLKLEERNQQAEIVAKEIDGEVLENASGKKVTTGLYGKGPAAKQKISQLNLLQKELREMQKLQLEEKLQLEKENRTLEAKGDSSMKAFSLSTDYLQRELALEQLKDKNSIVSLTQWLLISLFVLVDILPLIFKTFSPFGLYEKVVADDAKLVHEIDPKKRLVYLQSSYEKLSKTDN